MNQSSAMSSAAVHDLVVKHLERVARLRASHVLNQEMPDLSRRIVRAYTVAKVEGSNIDVDRIDRPVEYDEYLTRLAGIQQMVNLRADVRNLDLRDRCLLLQALLDCHLRQAHDWMRDHKDATSLYRASEIPFPWGAAESTALAESLASRLVTARHGFCTRPLAAAEHQAADRRGRMEFAELEPSIQVEVIFLVARSAAQVANACE